MSSARRIAITTSSFGEFSPRPLEVLKAKGVDYVLNPTGRALDKAETKELLAGCQAVVAGTEVYTPDLMDALPLLQCISRCGAGMDSVDLVGASVRGIKVVNTPDGPTRAVAELTVALAMNLVRHVGEMDKQMAEGVWKKKMGRLIEGLKIGIIGMGRIGKKSAALFTALGCEVIFHDPFVKEVGAGYRWLSLPELLVNAELVCLHCPAREDKKPVIGGAELRLLPEGAWLVNTARGGLVDEAALIKALDDGHIAGAALDVFSTEPYSGPLAGHPKVITTPHVGSYAREARARMELAAVENLLQVMEW